MTQDTKVKIPEGSPLPYIAALLSFLSAILLIVYERNKFNAPAKFIAFYIILPVVFSVLFSVLAAALAKKKLQLMIIPVCLISLYYLFLNSGICDAVMYRDWDILSYYWGRSAIQVLLICVLMLLVLIFGILAFSGTDSLSLPFVVICAVNFIANVIIQVWQFLRYHYFYTPWYLFHVMLFLGAFITLALAIQNDKKYRQSTYSVPPLTPYPSPAPMYKPMAPGPQYQPGSAPAADQQFMGRPYMNQQVPIQGQAYNNLENNMQPQSDTFEKINQLYEMNMKGIITNEEFEAKKKELLSKI